MLIIIGSFEVIDLIKADQKYNEPLEYVMLSN